MHPISIRLPDRVVKELDIVIKKIGKTRSEYVRISIEKMNKNFLLEMKRNRLQNVSKRVREESMRVNKEFSCIEYEN